VSEPVIIRKNARESYRLAWETYEGNRFLDLRVFFTAPDGELRPSRKGVALNGAALPEIIAALQAAQREGGGG